MMTTGSVAPAERDSGVADIDSTRLFPTARVLTCSFALSAFLYGALKPPGVRFICSAVTQTTGATVGTLGDAWKGESNGKLCLSPKIRPLVPKQ
jgi:hypothetical protein